MVGGIQAIIYYVLLIKQDSRLSDFDFWILALITMLIAASGYVINDFLGHRTKRDHMFALVLAEPGREGDDVICNPAAA